MDVVGGFAPFPWSMTNVPPFTLYADGRVIFQSPQPSSGRSSAPLRQALLDRQAADELVRKALDQYGLRVAREEYAVDAVADATTTVFTVAAHGVDKTVSVYGLGFGEEGPDRQTLRRLARLSAHLLDPSRWAPAHTSIDEYEPERYRGIFVEDDPEGPDLTAWPWSDLTPSDLQPLGDAVAFSQADLTPEQVALLAQVPNGGAYGIAIASPDGQAAWRLSIRPLLPDEDLLPAPAPSPSAGPAAPIAPHPDDQYTTDDYAYEVSA
jgi:hypothetical protein